MTTRLDYVLQKFPDHEEGIRLLASRDPSQNLKYLEWGARMLAARQALAPEIADVTALFHEFRGRPADRRARTDIIPWDIYACPAQGFAKMRDALFKLKRARDRKRRQREKLYHLDRAVDAEVIYDAEDLVVRHIKNKEASVHYGLNTKWCTSMLRANYFEDYQTRNATFFFFERKKPLGDEYDKVALVVFRDGERGESGDAFTALDHRIGWVKLAKVFGARVFDILRDVCDRSAQYPDSAMYKLHKGTASSAELEDCFNGLKSLQPWDVHHALESICCNDAAPFELLQKIEKRLGTILRATWKRRPARGRRHMRIRSGRSGEEKALARATRDVRAALAVHPNVPDAERERLVKALRRSRVKIESIHRTYNGGEIRIEYETPYGFNRFGTRRGRRLHRRRRLNTVSGLLREAKKYDSRASRMRKRAATLRRKNKRRAGKRS